MDVLRLFDAAIPEQVIAVPKISRPSRPLRAALPPRRWRNSWWKCQRTCWLSCLGSFSSRPLTFQFPLADLQGFSPMSSTAPQFVKQNVDIPVPGGRGSSGKGGLQGFHTAQSSLQPSVEQIVDIPFHRGGLQGFSPGQGSQRTVEQIVDIPLGGGSSKKKCEGLPAGQCRSRRGHQLMDAGGF